MRRNKAAADTYDPSENVLALVNAAVQRLDDLSAARKELADERHGAVLREMAIRAEYSARMDAAEASRLNALRDLDRLEAKTANDRHQAAVDTLAKATATMADTLRASAENTARNLAIAADAAKKELDARLSAVERFQAAGSGKGAGLNAAWAILGSLIALLAAIYALGPKIFGH